MVKADVGLAVGYINWLANKPVVAETDLIGTANGIIEFWLPAPPFGKERAVTYMLWAITQKLGKPNITDQRNYQSFQHYVWHLDETRRVILTWDTDKDLNHSTHIALKDRG